jgi:hypothetical protein
MSFFDCPQFALQENQSGKRHSDKRSNRARLSSANDSDQNANSARAD